MQKRPIEPIDLAPLPQSWRALLDATEQCARWSSESVRINTTVDLNVCDHEVAGKFFQKFLRR